MHNRIRVKKKLPKIQKIEKNNKPQSQSLNNELLLQSNVLKTIRNQKKYFFQISSRKKSLFV